MGLRVGVERDWLEQGMELQQGEVGSGGEGEMGM